MKKKRFLFWIGVAFCLGAAAFGEVTMSGNSQTDSWRHQRERMVREQIEARGVKNHRVLEAMRKVPRHLFIPEAYRNMAYEDTPVPIGEGQTISQPYIVAYMTEALKIQPTDRVLEVGTGSGYQAAILGELAAEVYTIEILPALGKRAAAVLAKLGYENVHVRIGDGYLGWPEEAPFDAIILTAAPPHIPEPLLQQLADGGRLIAPVGVDFQQLVLVRKKQGQLTRENLLPVRFVPMTGQAQTY